MKRTITLLLAALMIVSLVPVFGTVVSAEGNTAAKSTYVAYSENFDDLDAGAASSQILEALGWYIPDGKEGDNLAQYSAVDSNGGKALRVSTQTHVAGLGNTDSFVTVFSGDLMDVVRNGDFILSYDLTYRAGTTNANGYSAMIYNYNEKSGVSAATGNAVSYGIVAVRACGAGFNNLYYPISGGSVDVLVEGMQNSKDSSKDSDFKSLVMSNRYSLPSSDSEVMSLYARLVSKGAIEDDTYVETNETTLQGTVRMVDKTMNIKLAYNYDDGMSVSINGTPVSVPNKTDDASDYANTGAWNQFIDRTTGSALGLVTAPNVVADIDNIEVLAETTIGDKAYGEGLPELVITEVNPIGWNPTGNADYAWAEYVEIYNPTDHAVDLSEYSFMVAPVVEGGADDMTIGSNHVRFKWAQDLGELFGKPMVHTSAQYVSKADIAAMDSSRYEYVDEFSYKQSGSGYTKDDKGGYRRIYYVENWNTRYTIGAKSYNSNSMLNPGQCMLLFTMNNGNINCFKYGVNCGFTSLDAWGGVGDHDTDGSDYVSFRSLYAGKGCSDKEKGRYCGLSQYTKILAMNAFNLHDNGSAVRSGGWVNANVRYYIGKTYRNAADKAAGKKINYTKHYINDANIDPYVVSWCDWNSSVDVGSSYEGTDVNSEEFGKAGQTPDTNTEPATGVYVYGVDASGDPRGGTRYRTNNLMKSEAHVGRLAGYQEIIMKDLYDQTNNTMAALSITEIVARTNNLVGEESNAFSAIELTNTSGKPLNLYRYALVRTKSSMYPNANGTLVTIGRDEGFAYSTIMKAGNPITLGERNGAYYHFADNSISNPATCVLQPGESAVVWLITSDTYESYGRDADFTTDYFRQYWVNQGNNQLAVLNEKGEYATKVIAVDANTDTATNFDNANRVFTIDPTHSAIYGVANASYDVKKGMIKDRDVISFAFLGACASYMKLEWTELVKETGTYYANVLTRTIPVNRSVRYIVGGAGNNKASAMTNSMKIQFWGYYEKGSWSSLDPTATPYIEILNSDGTVEPRLGTLDGEELNPVRDTLLVSEKEQNGDVTYRYFDALRTGMITAEGAAMATNGSAQLRFDNVINNNIYSALVATYGKNVKIGMLIVETSLLGDKTTFTKADLDSSGIAYQDVNCSLLYRTSDYTVLGATLNIDQAKYGTSYTAVGYMTVTLHDGTVKHITSNVSTARSLAEVAELALEDVSEVATDVYTEQNADGTYSRYSAAVQDVLRGYVGQ